jgi:hypothetical protein
MSDTAGISSERGMDTFINWTSGDHERQVEVFAGEVVPAEKEGVRSARS